MEATLKARIVESLLRESATDDLGRVAQHVREVHLEMVHTFTAFVRLCGVLVEIREEYGQEAFRGVLGVLGLDEQLVQDVYDQALKVRSIPPDRLEQLFRSIAVDTARQIGLIGGANGHPDR